MIVRYSQIALAELDLIYTHIELDDSTAAGAVKRKIQAAIDDLVRFPKQGRPFKALPGLFKLVISGLPYTVYYEIGDGEIRIARIYHGARDIPF